jgi:hypothetical protein
MEEFTVEQAIELAKQHATWYPGTKSTSRTLVDEIARLKAELELHKATLRWCLENGAVLSVHYIDGKRCPRLVNSGDYDSLAVPPEYAPLIADAVKP